MLRIDSPELRGCVGVFRDREHAGRALARLLPRLPFESPLLLAIPAGGVPVAVAAARALGWPLDVAAVSKLTPPWNREVGYGAVAWDGGVLLNDALVARLRLPPEEIAAETRRKQHKVERRMRQFRRNSPPLALAGRHAVLVDDGLASGFTVRAAIAACRRAGAARIAVAIPTGHGEALAALEGSVDAVVCANLRHGPRFAVADAYQDWHDVPDARAEILLERLADERGDLDPPHGEGSIARCECTRGAAGPV